MGFLTSRTSGIQNADAFARRIVANKIADHFRRRSKETQHTPRSADEKTFVEPVSSRQTESEMGTDDALRYLRDQLKSRADLQQVVDALVEKTDGGHAVNQQLGEALGMKPEAARRRLDKLKAFLSRKGVMEKLRQMLVVAGMRKQE